MAKDVWGLETEIRKEAERLESTMCDVNGDTDSMKDEIQSHLVSKHQDNSLIDVVLFQFH